MSTESQNEKERNEMIVKRIDFEHGSIPSNILNAAIPMLVAQLLSLLYNIIDRIYIARIPHIGTTALGTMELVQDMGFAKEHFLSDVKAKEAALRAGMED